MGVILNDPLARPERQRNVFGRDIDERNLTTDHDGRRSAITA